MFRIGVIIESFQKPVLEALDDAKRLGAEGVQLYATDGEFDPDTVRPERVRALKTRLSALGLAVPAVCGDMGGHGFAFAADNPARVEKSRRILDFALEIGSKVVTTHIGVLPEDPSCKRYAVMRDACAELAEYASAAGGVFAIETGPEKVRTLKGFLKDVGSKGLGVNYDPANLHMVTHEDEVAGVFELAGSIVHTHAKDGLRGKKFDPGKVYEFFASGGIGDLNLKDYFTEMPLGEGGVRFDEYLSALREIGYDGFLTVERELTDTPIEDIAAAIRFLRTAING